MRIAGHTQAPSSRAATFYASRTLLNRNLQIDVLRERYDKQIKLRINVQIINYLLAPFDNFSEDGFVSSSSDAKSSKIILA